MQISLKMIPCNTFYPLMRMNSSNTEKIILQRTLMINVCFIIFKKMIMC